MSKKEPNENQQKININYESNIEEVKSIKNKDNPDITVNSNISSAVSRRLNDNILYNLLNKNNNKKLKSKVCKTIDKNSIESVKQDIINFYLIEQMKNEEKKREIETNRFSNTYSSSYNNLNILTQMKNNGKNKNKNSNNNKKEINRFEKYDKERLSYEIYHQYQKLNFDYEQIPFVQRMQLYALKKCLKDYKIEELTNLRSPKMSEKRIIHTFNRLIEDSNRRNCKVSKSKKFGGVR